MHSVEMRDNMLTEKQKEIFDIIKSYIVKEKIPPTIREIGH